MLNNKLQICMMKLANANQHTLNKIDDLLDGRIAQEDRLLTNKEAAKMLGISKSTLWRMVKNHTLTMCEISQKIKRIRLSDVQLIINSHRSSTGGSNA